MKINKQKLIELLLTKSDLSKKQINNFINVLCNVMQEQFLQNNNIAFGNLGIFKIKENSERNGINPVTQESIVIPKRKTVKFSVAKNIIALLKAQ